MINKDLTCIQLFTAYKAIAHDLSLTIFCIEDKEAIGAYGRVRGTDSRICP